MDLARFPRRRYTHAPTPIEPLPHFTKALAASCPGGVGPEIWIKRDDLLGLFPGGNKTRKLEFLAADALAQGADTLITCGAPQSNHCRITLSAAIKEGLKCRFVIEERVPGSYKKEASGNNFMFELMGVEAITVVPGGSDMGGRHVEGRRRKSPRSAARATSFPAAARTRSAAWATSPACRKCRSSGRTWGWRSMPSWSARAARAPMAAWWRASSATTSRSR